MKSMTGYGKSTLVFGSHEITVELKSVNHRYSDISIKLPRIFNAYEDAIKKTITAAVSRGHVDCFISYLNRGDGTKKVSVDLGLARSILQAADTLKGQFALKDDFQLNALMKTSDVLVFESQEADAEEIKKLLIDAVTQTAQQLNAMRIAEGIRLSEVICARLDEISRLTDQVKQFAPQVVRDYQSKLTDRVTEALGSLELDKTRLINEVAFFTDKANIDEEIDRLHSHIVAARTYVLSTEPNGRKLDFIIQEMNREANTICSKSNNISITKLGVELKNEIEKVREQCQNLE